MCTKTEMKDSSQENDWMTSKELAIYLRLITAEGKPDSFRVRTLVHQGRLPFYKPFGRLLFSKKEVDDLIKKSKTEAWKWR